MCDPAFNDPWSSDDLTWRGQSAELIDIRIAKMLLEGGRRQSPAFEQLKDYLRVPFEIPGRVIAEFVEMLRPRCFADSQSYRQPRGAVLWTELHWLREEMLVEAFADMWRPQYYPWWKSSALIKHANSGPALWMRVLSRRVDVRTLLDIVTEATKRGDTAFLQHLENSLAAMDIVASIG